MPSIADAAAQVLAAGVPVLFLDTCSILDVIRAPERRLDNCIEAGTELLAMATQAPSQCSLVIASVVPQEWTDHREATVDLLDRHLNKMQADAARFHQVCGHLGVPITFAVPQYIASGLAAHLHDLSRDLLKAASLLDGSPETKSRAYERVVVTRRRPSRQGGQLADCTIFEECLEVCRVLQASGFARKMVFCTSNTADYCAPGATPHADVDADCTAVGMTFTKELPWALHEVTNHGHRPWL
jgi:hypothetical protein